MPRTHARLRRIAIGAAFVVSVTAIAATTPGSTTIDLPSEVGSFRLDAERPAALSRIIVRLSPEATSSYSNPRVALIIDQVSGIADDPAGSGGDERIRFIVTSGTPRAPSDAGESLPPADEPIPSAWQAEAQRGRSLQLPIDCGSGPCERAFWLIAQLSDMEAGPIEVEWHVEGSLTFSGSTWPSGAGGSFEVAPPVLAEGPLPQLVVSTSPESLTLGARNPAAARVIEVRIGGGAIPADGGPGAVLSVALERQGGGSSSRPPLITVYPLDAADGDQNPDGPLPTAAPRDFDPFSGCDPAAECTRRFLVTLEWTGEGEDETFGWTATVRRLDVARSWSAPAELAATVQRRFDIDRDARPSVMHFEGEATTSDAGLPAQVQVELATQTSASSPTFRLLPAPAAMTYRATVLASEPAASGGGPRVTTVVSLPGWESGGVTQIHAGSDDGRLTVTTNPLAGCRVGDACPSLTIATIAVRDDYDAPRPTVRYAWRLDVTLYSFAEAPLDLATLDHSP